MNSVDLVNRFFVDGYESVLQGFAKMCAKQDDAESLKKAIGLGLGPRDLLELSDLSARSCSVKCLRLLLEQEVPCAARDFHSAAGSNCFDILELALRHGTGWCPRLPGVAACAVSVRFLMHIVEAGCPAWTRARDGEPCHYCTGYCPLETRLIYK
jgi:hypothetical protein